VYGRRMSEFQEVKMLDEGKMRISSRLLPHDATVDIRRVEGLSQMTKAMFRAGAREHRVPPLSVPFSRLGPLHLSTQNPQRTLVL
jgi:hypothetical protein